MRKKTADGETTKFWREKERRGERCQQRGVKKQPSQNAEQITEKER